MEITITKEDLKESTNTKEYSSLENQFLDRYNCPLSKAVKRALNTVDCITVGTSNVRRNKQNIGNVNPNFGFKDFEDLYYGRIESFTTELTLINQ